MSFKQKTFSNDGVEVILTYDDKELIVEAINYHNEKLDLRVEVEGHTYDCTNMQWRGPVSKQAASNIGIILNDTYKYFNLT